MATWKERGVVPDSDDEDTLDTQDDISLDRRNNDKNDENDDNGLYDHGNNVGNSTEVVKAAVRIAESFNTPQPAEDGCLSLDPASSTLSKHLGDTGKHGDVDVLMSQSVSNTAFGMSGTTDGLPLLDDVSTSYVHFTSSMTSSLSSVPDTESQTISEDVEKPNLQTESVLQAFQQLNNDHRRALRQRNPNQLKPYTVEQVKYRAVMKARGMAPTRIEQTPDEFGHRARAIYSSDNESQELYSQGIDLDTQDSQQENGHTSSLPASPKQKSPVRHQEDTSDPFGSDNDEIPDIDELLLRRDFLPKSSKVTRPKKTYSAKPKFKKPRGIHFKPQRQHHRYSNDSLDVFDVPASPPATSPLPECLSTTLPELQTRAPSFPLQEPMTSSLDFDELGFDLPTPATSAAKQVPSAVLVEFDSDSDDPFASQQISEASPKSSSDESIQIRKVGKTIRGVLPASHLRLIQVSKDANTLIPTGRPSVSASPEKQPFRRGVAIPKVLGTRHQSPTPANIESPFFSDDSNESETETHWDKFSEIDNDAGSDLNFEQRTGFAEEEDRVDAMLPVHKRQRAGYATGPRKKRRIASGGNVSTRQLKMTDCLIPPPKPLSSKSGGRGKVNKVRSRRPPRDVPRARNSTPPRLSILDITSEASERNEKCPLFIKVAARTARARKDLGRQSPSRKFIRLATREDTIDAQSVLQDWKDCKIKPQKIDSRCNRALRIEKNRQMKISSPNGKANSQLPRVETRATAVPRRLLISKDRHQSKKTSVIVDDQQEPSRLLPQTLSRWDTVVKQKDARSIVDHPSRPAQLETTETAYSSRYPTTAFKTTKKSLDSFYKTTQKRRSNVQISRYLADGNTIKPSTEAVDHAQPVVDSLCDSDKVSRKRKRHPQRLDAGASVFRQSSEPLILDYFVPAGQDVAGQSGKLTGLGKFGTKYPVHFDILPLQSGIYFQQNTFIGSGRLYVTAPNISVIKPPLCFDLSERQFQWSLWDENVSSEVGLCFDWVLDQLNQGSTNVEPYLQENPARVVTCIIDYVQNHLSVTSSQNQVEFLSRMVEVIGDFASRLATKPSTEEELQPQYRVSVASRCTVLVLQILQISRSQPKQASTSMKLEAILECIAQCCIKLLLLQGLGEIRALYEKLQYLSFRESGIADTDFQVEAWVVIIKSLGIANIPRCSFWDLTNKLLLPSETLVCSDAREMEIVWYSVFSLLPLCEFDEFGVVVQGARHNACFDNWALPQRMLKNMFSIYSSTARQSPGFNDYCRTIISRCHLLILDWGWWKCGVIIGTLFDFFASQNLAHLRNEEVHNSPRFLDELDAEPSLRVEPEDRCFHIFLKIIALEIKHLQEIDEQKGIRNLVTRLLPNHNRQYLKEEAILERELAALRNHHDLLATLYWAAPANQRPPPSLIQNLVEPDRSHNAACLINLKAWKQLAVFLLASPTPTDAFAPLVSWQNTFFDKLLEQYLQEEVNTRKQAEGPAGDSIPETSLLQQIMSNRASTMTMLNQTISNMLDAVVAARNISGLEFALNKHILDQLLSNDIVVQDESVIVGITKIVYCYIDKVNVLHPYEFPNAALDAQAESQDSIGIDLCNWERNRLATYLLDNSAVGLCSLVRKVLDRAELIKGISVVNNLISCWASYVGIATEEYSKLNLFLPGGPHFVFYNRNYHGKPDYYWSLFLCELLARKPIADFEAVGFDIGLEWLRILVLPSSFSQSTLALSQRMAQAYHPIVSLEHGRTLRDFYAKQAGNESLDWPSVLIKDAISRMVVMLQAPEAGTEEFRTLKEQYSSYLKLIMNTMEHQLRSMVPSSVDYKTYMVFVQQVASHICSHADHILPLTLFLRGETDRNYVPRGLYIADLSKYIRRLNQQPERTSSELFYFLFESFKRDTAEGHLKDHVRNFKQALESWEFTKYILQTYLPAVITSSWETKAGWMLAGTYLPPLANHIASLLSARNAVSIATYSHTISLLKMMTNKISNASSLTGDDRILTVHPQNRGAAAITYGFWLSIYPALKSYCADFPINVQVSARDPFLQIKFSFEKFETGVLRIFKARITFGFHWDIVQHELRLRRWDLEVTFNENVQTFAAFLTRDINGWENVDNMAPEMLFCNGWVCNKALVRGGGPTKIALRDFWGPTLRELLFKSSGVYNPVKSSLNVTRPTHRVVSEVKDMTVKAVDRWQAFNCAELQWMRKIRDPKGLKFQDKE